MLGISFCLTICLFDESIMFRLHLLSRILQSHAFLWFCRFSFSTLFYAHSKWIGSNLLVFSNDHRYSNGSLCFSYQVTSFLFVVEEKTDELLSRCVLLIWLFVVLIINSSYTASLTSILTMQQLSSPIKGIETLINSNDPISYQQGSYARSYLVEELGIHSPDLFLLILPKIMPKP